MNQQVAAALICGDVEKSDLLRCLDSLDPHVGGVFIAFNGVGAFPLTKAECVQYRVSVKKFDWKDDFSWMRQRSFEMVPKDEYRWMLWIDTDDTLEMESPDSLTELIDGLDEFTQGVFLRYDYLVDKQTGAALIQHWRERLMRTDNDWRWEWPVHETCHGRPGTQYARREGVWVKHQRDADDEDRNTTNRERNRRILTRARKAHPEEPRFTLYLAREVHAAADKMEEGEEKESTFRAAVKLYEEFIGKSHFNDDAYTANASMADCLRSIGEHNRAIDVDLQGIKLYPTWPQSYVGIARSCLSMGEYDKVRHWSDLCIRYATTPTSAAIHEPMNILFTPYLLRAIAWEEENHFQNALADYQTALEAQPHNEFVEEKIAHIGRIIEQTPHYAFDTEEEIPLWKQQRKLLRGSSSQKSIAFVTRPLFEPWHPAYELQGGAGGAETCIMRLAPLFVRDGWRVAVFGTPGALGGTDPLGIEWYPADEWLADEEFTVTVASRVPELFDSSINSRVKLLWMHDVSSGPDLPQGEWEPRIPKMDGVIGLSPWHVDHLMKLYKIPREKMMLIPNGINLDLYDLDLPGGPTIVPGRDPNRFIYSSSPDRGLDVVIRLWPEIKKINPDAELHVYYGWTAIDKIIATGNMFLTRFKLSLMSAVEEIGGEEGGIFWHDRVPQHVLAEEQMKSMLWLYPTFFQETFCITAVEMQAAGVIPVTSHVGALKQMIARQELTVPGWPNNKSFGSKWLRLIDEVLTTSEPYREELRISGRMFAKEYSWEAAFKVWKGYIEELLLR